MDQATLLKEIGLSAKEAKIYQILLKLGVSPAKKLILESEMPRGTVYEVLDQLTNKGLVEQFEDKKKTHFRVKHPFTLKNYLADEIGKIKQAETKLESVLPDFLSVYNLTQNRPGVEFYEGVEGVKKVILESLQKNSTVCLYSDIESVDKYIPEINKLNRKISLKNNVLKKIIVVDTPYTREKIKTIDLKLREIRVIKAPTNFATAMQIYGNRISYITLAEDKMIGVIIEDERINQMHQLLFNFCWNIANPINQINY